MTTPPPEGLPQTPRTDDTAPKNVMLCPEHDEPMLFLGYLWGDANTRKPSEMWRCHHCTLDLLRKREDKLESLERDLATLKAERDAYLETLRFIERMVNHHGQKPAFVASPKEILSWIQHHPDVEEITLSYSDGKIPPTPNPYAEAATLKAIHEELGDVLRETADALEYAMKIDFSSNPQFRKKPDHALTKARAAIDKA